MMKLENPSRRLHADYKICCSRSHFRGRQYQISCPLCTAPGAKRILLVSDPGVEDAGWVEVVMDLLRADNLECEYFNEVSSNPRDWQVHKGAELYAESGADVIVGLGGGSPIDAAKGISTIIGNGGRIRDYEGANKIMRPLPPMIFIPSTAGSGSDVSQFCIITDVERQVKISIISRSLVPNLSIIDPTLLATKSRELILASAVDAMAHAVESYVSRLASPFPSPRPCRRSGCLWITSTKLSIPDLPSRSRI